MNQSQLGLPVFLTVASQDLSSCLLLHPKCRHVRSRYSHAHLFSLGTLSLVMSKVLDIEEVPREWAVGTQTIQGQVWFSCETSQKPLPGNKSRNRYSHKIGEINIAIHYWSTELDAV